MIFPDSMDSLLSTGKEWLNILISCGNHFIQLFQKLLELLITTAVLLAYTLIVVCQLAMKFVRMKKQPLPIQLTKLGGAEV